MHEERREGWAIPFRANKYHYFGTDRRALCGRWLFLGTFNESNQIAARTSEDCGGCTKKLEKLRAQQESRGAHA